MFLSKEVGGLALEDDELVDILSLNLVDELNEVAVTTVLTKMLGTRVRQLILDLDLVDANLALLHPFFYEKISQRDVLCARTVGPFAGDVQRRRGVDVQWNAVEALVEYQLQHHVEAEHCLLHL